MVIGTHHGKFHADEVFAVAMLKQLYPDARIVRSREPEVLSQCDIIVDVGRGEYDHHTTDKVFRENGLPYASAGLVWRDFGTKVVRHLGCNEENSDSLTDIIDEKLIQAIDAIDNGIDLEKDARIKGVSELVGGFNPPWNSDADENFAFQDAVSFATQILVNQIKSEIGRIEATAVVKEAYEHRSDKALLVLDTFCPWTDTLFELDVNSEVLYVIFPDRSGEYRLQVVPKSLGSFEARKPLPESWAGTEGDELNALTGADDAVFCHPARFIAGAKSLTTILHMAKLALNE
ncbi:MYG1 family protein [Alicyclobacillus dauci]|uniref:MYG1 family protein n=1 Tax=Alicyclobacillus dauci TaxID=1475485 RepID=A0ABY6YXY2_9BACL|nr:MYG1 family protein [Alicyclobacillus dauci]WAH35416.1 MYG1 family protein [Alicyclobacillus dauci]